MSIRPAVIVWSAILLLGLAAAVEASTLLDFGAGPAQWLMTAAEQRAWRNVKTEEAAREFIDLYWARRDPTLGTPRNEFREEFDGRVAFADEHFREGKRRGALTDRGRVLIALGFPREMAGEVAKWFNQQTVKVGNEAATGGWREAARAVWTYEHAAATKYGLPKIEVVFVFDGLEGEARRDPQRADFTRALPGAIRYAIKNPELTSVPDWARSGVQWKEATVIEEIPLVEVKSDVPIPPPASVEKKEPAPPPLREAGARKLTLVADAFAIDPQRGSDPFASLPARERFASGGDLGWAAEYCTGAPTDNSMAVAVSLRISGVVRGEPVSFTAPEEEMVPDTIKAWPGCYLVRGSVPLIDVEPGTYQLTVTIGRYNLTREFRVE